MEKNSSEPNIKEKEPKVVLLGQEVSPSQKEKERWGRHHDGGGAVFGAILIFSGIILLLNTFGIVPWEVWRVILQFWPLLLVLIGLNIILGNNIVSRFILALLSIIVFGSVVILALNEVSPDLLRNLPPDLLQWVRVWEDFRR